MKGKEGLGDLRCLALTSKQDEKPPFLLYNKKKDELSTLFLDPSEKQPQGKPPP